MTGCRHEEKLAKVIENFRRKCDCESCQQYRKENPTITELAKQSGLKYITVYTRIKVLKWDCKIATTTSLTTPRAYKKIINKLNGNRS